MQTVTTTSQREAAREFDPSNSLLLTKEDLRIALKLPSKRMIDEMMRKRKIPFIKLGHRTVRFELPKVMAALQQLEVSSVLLTSSRRGAAKTAS